MCIIASKAYRQNYFTYDKSKNLNIISQHSLQYIMADNKSKETDNIAQDSSEIFDTYKKGVLKITEELSKFQPQYAQSISKLQEEYLQLTKQFVDKVFAAQPNWTNTPYSEQFRRQSNEITAQALSVFNTSNQLAINALTAAKENVKLYGKAMDAIMKYNNNVANAWSSFFTSAQRQQYFRQ